MASRPLLIERRLLFVTGKGGVGKTAVTAAVGLHAARCGLSTLIVEIDAKGDMADFLGVGPLQFSPTTVNRKLSAMAMDTEASLKEYLRLQLKVPLVARIGPLAAALDFVATAAPGVKEILTVGKVAWEVRERHYDLVVVDAPATGHVIGQLASPDALSELVHVGVIRDQTAWMTELLTDHATTGVVVVTTPEEMPVNEALEVIERLRAETRIELAAVFANRTLPPVFTPPAAELFELVRGRHSEFLPGWESLCAAAGLATALAGERQEHLRRLQSQLPSSTPVVELPELFVKTHGVRMARRLSELVAEALR